MRPDRSMNSSGERNDVGVAGAGDDPAVGRRGAVQAAEVFVVEGQNAAAGEGGEGELGTVGVALPPDLVNADHIMAEEAQLHGDRNVEVLVAVQQGHRSIALIVANSFVNLVRVVRAIGPGNSQVGGG